MKDILITNYLGPGTYLLCNYPQQFGIRIAEKGYKIYYCDDIRAINEYITSYKINHILIHDNENDLTKFISLFKQLSNCQIDNIVIETIVNTKHRSSFFDFIENAYKNNYVKKSSFFAINKHYDPSFRNNQHLNIALSYSADTPSFKSNDETNEPRSFRIISNITPYIRPGDQVAVISNLQIRYSGYLNEQTKACNVDNFTLDDITKKISDRKPYHFIIIDGYGCCQIESVLSALTKLLLPAGRLVIMNPSLQIVNALEEFNITPEIFFELIRGNFVANIYQGEAISVSSEVCVFMKSPLESTDYPYQETIYGYSQPPENLLAFERDYNNPWIIRGIVEFPFRNRSAWNLKKYCIDILKQYNSLTPDYAAALAVLGYQVINGEEDSENIIEKISTYCTNIATLEQPNAHQIRWFISLSTLLGLIHNKNNNKIEALINFSHAANVCVDKFSPSIGTKVLQSLYFNSIILLSLNKNSCAEITIDRALRRGISLLSQKPEEFIGKFSQPFNFVMFIYHDVIDWIIKLINIKNSILSKNYYMGYLDDTNAWSALLQERMDAINEMSQMINDRDITIQSQQQLIDEHNNTILMQKKSINNKDHVIHDHEKFIDEIEQTLKQQNQLINTIKLNGLENNKIISELKDKEQQFIQSGDKKEIQLNLLTAELKRQEAILFKIYNLPIVGFLLRKLNIK